MKGYSLQDLADETILIKTSEALQWDTEKSKGENVPLGLQLFRSVQEWCHCFYKTQFKFVPAFQELQQSASVETSCIPYFRTLECLLHQNPANRGGVQACPPQFSFASPPEVSVCAARLRSLLQHPLAHRSSRAIALCLEWFKGEQCLNKNFFQVTHTHSFHWQISSKKRSVWEVCVVCVKS